MGIGFMKGSLAIAALALAPLAAAQQAPSAEDLSAQATEPTAALMSFQLDDWYTASFHGLDDTANEVVFRAAIPLSLAERRRRGSRRWGKGKPRKCELR
jgi:ABC-type sugar transport system substrate-binding protein